MPPRTHRMPGRDRLNPPRLGDDKSERSAKIDAIIALSMALDRAEQRSALLLSSANEASAH
jgi:hypothetical protein